MHARRFLYAQLIILAALAAIHVAAIDNTWYWEFRWLDILTHFLGGMWAALFASWLLIHIGYRPAFLSILGIVAVIGVGWETFEFLAGFPQLPNYPLDTAGDLIMDFLGGAVAALIAMKLIRA